MTITIPSKPDFPSVIDNTIRTAYKRCPRNMYLTYLLHLKPAVTSIHLHAGKCYAKGLETFRRAYYQNSCNREECSRQAFVAVIREWGAIDSMDSEKKSLWTIILAVETCFEHWPVETDHIRPFMSQGTAALEFNFTFPIPDVYHPVSNDPILYCGRYDMLGEMNGQLMILDDKTTSGIGPYWLQQWDLNSQLTGYCCGAATHGYKVAGALVRGVALNKEFKYEQVIQYRTKWEIDRWLMQLSRDVKAMIANWNEGFWDYDLSEGCAAYGGCDNKTLCTAEKWQDWIEPEFVVRRWNPLTPHDEEELV